MKKVMECQGSITSPRPLQVADSMTKKVLETRKAITEAPTGNRFLTH